MPKFFGFFSKLYPLFSNSVDIFLLCVSGSSKESVHVRVCVHLCACMCVFVSRHEASVDLSLAESAGAAAVLHSAGAGI